MINDRERDFKLFEKKVNFHKNFIIWNPLSCSKSVFFMLVISIKIVLMNIFESDSSHTSLMCDRYFEIEYAIYEQIKQTK